MRIRLTWLGLAASLLALSGACSSGLRAGADDDTGGSAGERGSGGRDSSGGKSSMSGGREGSGGEAGSTAGGSSGGGKASGGAAAGGADGSGGMAPACEDESCPEHASCSLDQDRETTCQCDDGFEEDEAACVDIDECAEENECSPQATCENTEGGYDCTCKNGFLGDGRTCVPRTRLLSQSSPSAGGNGPSQYAALSADGRFVAFGSPASDLVPNDVNAEGDAFVFDLTTGSLERVSVDSLGVEADLGSYSPSLSADGRYVVFDSYATNLVAGDTNGAIDVFRRDRTDGVTIRASVTASGGEAIGAQGYSAFPTISNDGTRVAFTSFAPNLVPGDTNGYLDTFVRDLANSTTTRISVTSSGAQVDDPGLLTNTSPQIAGGGRHVAFVSISPQLGGGNDNYSDAFLRDLTNDYTLYVSQGAPGQVNNGSSQNPSPSADGRFIVFHSSSSTLVAGDTNNADDVFIRDMSTGTIERVSVNSDEAQANERSFLSFQRSVSNDGRYVVFSSLASNLVSGDTNGYSDVFLRDRVNGTTTRVSVGPRGEEGNAPSSQGTMSADGRIVAFESASSTFGATTGNNLQVWARDLSP